jgi:Family of unknown function (DUF6502)
MQKVTEAVAQSTLRRLLRPIVKLMVHLGMPVQSFVEAVKAVYVDVAVTDFATRRSGSTDSQISVLTGVHRKDVKRLRETPLEAESFTPSIPTRVANLLNGVPECMDAKGRYLPLRRRSAVKTMSAAGKKSARTAAAPSLDEIIERVTVDVSPGAVIKDMVRQGMLKPLADGSHVLAPEWLVVNEQLADLLAIFSRNAADRVEAAVQNVMHRDHRHPVHSVYSHAISPAAVEQLKRLVTTDGEALMSKLNAMVASAENSLSPGEPALRMSCGIYLYSEPYGHH